MTGSLPLDPKSLDFAVQVSLLAYPSLYQIRGQVIAFMYCTLGNGMDWWDGRLQDQCDDEKIKTVTQMLIDGRSEDEIRSWVKAKDDERFDVRHKELEELCKKHGIEFSAPPLSMHPLRIYPIYASCHLMTLPDHIRADWLAGAEEVIGLIETHDSFDAASTLKNREFIPVIRERIQALRASAWPSGAGGTSALAI